MIEFVHLPLFTLLASLSLFHVGEYADLFTASSLIASALLLPYLIARKMVSNKISMCWFTLTKLGTPFASATIVLAGVSLTLHRLPDPAYYLLVIGIPTIFVCASVMKVFMAKEDELLSLESKNQTSRSLAKVKKQKLDIIGFGDDGSGYGILADERIHIAIFGETGSGKSETIKLLIKQCILRDEGFMLIDPHGMLARDVLSLIPTEKWDNVIYINPNTSMWYAGVIKINPLEHKTAEDRYIVAMSFVNALRNLYRESWGDRLEAILRNAANALVEVEGSTLRDMRMLITDSKFRKEFLTKIASTDTIHFWNETFDKLYRKDAGGAAYNKLDKILATPLVAAMLDAPKSSIDFSDIIKSDKFVVVDLGSGTSDDIASFLGSIVMHMLYVEAKRRIDRLESLDKPFYLFIDEAHLFSSFAIREVLNTLRKFNIKVTLATQTINAFSSRVANEIPALCRTIICFKCDRETANMFKDLLPISVEELISLSLHTFSFYSQGIPPALGIGRTRKMVGTHSEWKELARLSVERYGEAVLLDRYMPSKRSAKTDQTARVEEERKRQVEVEDLLPNIQQVNDIQTLYNIVYTLSTLYTNDKRRRGKISRKLGMYGQKWAIAGINMMIGDVYECCFGRGEPDGKPKSVIYARHPIAVKLVRLKVTYSGGRNVKGHKYVYSFLASRDAKAEVEWARQHKLEEIWLIVINISNLKWIFNGLVKFNENVTIRDYSDVPDVRH